MNIDKTDILVIGAGVVGLAIAAELSAGRKAPSLVFMERHESFGRETSSRNSEVIHAGIYYPTGTLKAHLCVEGKELLYSFCAQWGIAHQRCGKVIAANTPAESASLDALLAQALANGVNDLIDLDVSHLARLEPHLKATRALLSPSTGIVNSHGLMARLEDNAMQNGALPAYCHQVHEIEPLGNGYRVYFHNPDGSADAIDCSVLINCAGLQSAHIAALTGLDVAASGYRLHLCKGEYFSLPRTLSNRFNHLIYPPPLHELTGLGIHLTKTLDRRLRLGPNAIYVDSEDYNVDPTHSAAFYKAIKPFIPLIEAGDLQPEMAGIRPKLSGPGEPFRDFIIREESDRGLPGLVNLIGIESPGLTCCLSIARHVKAILNQEKGDH